MITESLMIFLTTVMSLNTPVNPTSVKNQPAKEYQQPAHSSNIRQGGWDLN